MSVITTDNDTREAAASKALGVLGGLPRDAFNAGWDAALTRVELTYQNESGCGYGDPFVAVMVNDVQYDKVWAYIDKEQGADGGWYNVVKFRRSGA